MDPDLSLTIGLVLAVFAIPSMVSAFSDRRSPRVSAIVVLIAGGLVVYALQTKETGYTLEQIPNAVIRTVAQFIG